MPMRRRRSKLKMNQQMKLMLKENLERAFPVGMSLLSCSRHLLYCSSKYDSDHVHVGIEGGKGASIA